MKYIRVLLSLQIVLLICVLGVQALEAAAVPHLVKFNGSVKDLNGKPLTGVAGLTFALYKDQEATAKDESSAIADLQASVRDLNERTNQSERRGLRNRLDWGGDYRFETHVIRGNIPTHYDGMQLQNLMVNTLWLFAPQSQGGWECRSIPRCWAR